MSVAEAFHALHELSSKASIWVGVPWAHATPEMQSSKAAKESFNRHLMYVPLGVRTAYPPFRTQQVVVFGMAKQGTTMRPLNVYSLRGTSG